MNRTVKLSTFATDANSDPDLIHAGGDPRN